MNIFKEQAKLVNKTIGVKLIEEDEFQVASISKENNISKSRVIRTIVHDWLKKENHNAKNTR